jgi:hypothetical protein
MTLNLAKAIIGYLGKRQPLTVPGRGRDRGFGCGMALGSMRLRPPVFRQMHKIVIV